MIAPLQYISQGPDHLSNIKSVLEAGGTWVQLRVKDVSENELENMAKEALILCKKHGATFILNDNPHLAKKIGADGVHLGLQDMPTQEARAILGNNAIIGGTANTLEDIQLHIAAGVDYIGLGPFRHTTTKKVLSPVLGIKGYTTLLHQLGSSIPIIAIGGIEEKDIEPLMHTGIHGIAVSGLLTHSNNKAELISSLNSAPCRN